MKKTLTIFSAISLTTVLFSSCTDSISKANSDKSYTEEITAYNDILNEIVDTTFYHKELKEHNGNIAIFFSSTLYQQLTIEATKNIRQTLNTCRQYLKSDDSLLTKSMELRNINLYEQPNILKTELSKTL